MPFGDDVRDPTSTRNDMADAFDELGGSILPDHSPANREVPIFLSSAWDTYKPDTLLFAAVTSAGSANAQTVDLGARAPAAYYDGFTFNFIAGTGLTNTASMTINVNSLGAKSVKDIYGANILPKLVTAGGMYQAMYHATSDVFIIRYADRVRWAFLTQGFASKTSGISDDTDYDLFTGTLTNIITSDLIQLDVFASLSSNVANDRLTVYSKIGSTDGSVSRLIEHTGATTGRGMQFASQCLATGLSGSVTIKAVWQRDSGTGNLYSQQCCMLVKVFKDGGSAT